MNALKARVAWLNWRGLTCSLALSLAVAGGVIIQNSSGAYPVPETTEAGGEKPAQSAPHTVSIQGYKYLPEVLTIKMGDKVQWKNEDDVPHTATSIQKGFDSGNLAAGGSWEFHATKPGEYLYYCTYHPNMKAKLIVK